MQRHVSWCVTVEKQIKVKITETEQREEQRSKQQGESKNFKLLHQLLSADLNSDVIDNVNVESLARLSVRQVRWLTKMAKNGHLIVRAITTAQDYQEGFMEESEEELDTDESLSGEDSDSLTENEECVSMCKSSAGSEAFYTSISYLIEL
ncbi:unnamed protein product [Porites evermanni]|uniref:Uncharacterized protein n=1 Tax=Porites evermanni TaxID=104178 RepID=A0ABN8RAZ5_9CNID|nr:unnamed protein product [Porites evermanni]